MDHIGEIIALGIDTIIFGLCYRLYVKQRNAIERVENALVLELNSDLEDIVKTHPGQKLPYVTIRGEVKALGSPITSVNNQSVTGTIQQLSMKERVVARNSAGFWFVEYILQFVFLPDITHHASENQYGAASGWIYLPRAFLGGHLTWAVIQ